MYQLIFRDVRIAALWVIGIAASVALFFSEGGGQEKLAQTADQIRARKAEPGEKAPTASVTVPAEPPENAAVPVDDTEAEPGIGNDPSDQSYSPGEASAGEVVENE